MAAYTTTRITNFTAPTSNSNGLTISDGANTYKLNSAPPPSESFELVAVGKAVFASDNNPTTLYSAPLTFSPNRMEMNRGTYLLQKLMAATLTCSM